MSNEKLKYIIDGIFAANTDASQHIITLKSANNKEIQIMEQLEVNAPFPVEIIKINDKSLKVKPIGDEPVEKIDIILHPGKTNFRTSSDDSYFIITIR